MSAETVLTDDAVEFLTRLQREFGPRREELLAARQERAQRLRERRAARLPAGDQRRPRGRLAGRAGAGSAAGPPGRDHRPGRPEDGDQRAQLGREDVHGRLRGLELADVGQLHRGPAQPHRRARAHDLTRHRREAVLAERRDRDAARAPARLAPRGTALRGRRRADLGEPVRLRPLLLPQPRARRHAGSTCRSSSRTWRRGSGTTSSSGRRTSSACRRGRSRRPS